MYQHLKDEAYYHTAYDRGTIARCRLWAKDKKSGVGRSKKKKGVNDCLIDYALEFIKGEEYRNKAETIRKWMERDRRRDEHQNNTPPPIGIRCLSCSSLMEEEHRTLHTELDEKDERLLFIFRCSRCQKGRAYWEDGTEWIYTRPCPKCRANLDHGEPTRKGKIIITLYSCTRCDYKEKDEFEADKKYEEKTDPNFEADRQKYCLSKKEGDSYIDWTARLKRAVDMMKDHKENKQVYETIAKIKKLTVVDLQKLLIPLLEKAGYIKFELDKPEVGAGLIVSFSAQDDKSDRQEYDSRRGLTRLLKKALEGTNWWLMSDGISYQLGFLTGRMRGVQSEEALKELVKNKQS